MTKILYRTLETRNQAIAIFRATVCPRYRLNVFSLLFSNLHVSIRDSKPNLPADSQADINYLLYPH